MLALENRNKELMAIIQSDGSLSNAIWHVITKNCAGKIDSLQELIVGKFPKTLSEVFTAKGKGLFPASKEIRFQCNCPDGAIMCKHVAAVLCGVGALDDDPTLFFVLRNVNVDNLISETLVRKLKHSLKNQKQKAVELLKMWIFQICLELRWKPKL